MNSRNEYQYNKVDNVTSRSIVVKKKDKQNRRLMD